jgi:hypothetical protein
MRALFARTFTSLDFVRLYLHKFGKHDQPLRMGAQLAGPFVQVIGVICGQSMALSRWCPCLPPRCPLTR